MIIFIFAAYVLDMYIFIKYAYITCIIKLLIKLMLYFLVQLKFNIIYKN